MAISTRELYLILRARDEASRVLRAAGSNINNLNRQQLQAAQRQIQVGTSLATVGTAMLYAGARAVAFWNDATNAAIEYNRETSLTLTQVDGLSTSLEELKKIGRDTASAIPAPFEQMQTALYDIFSSMDVNVSESKKLLTEFSKAAVAGQVDLQEADRATIGILNAYHMSASQVNHVNDVMFQLVRKGVGTYGEFATTIGLAVPSAVRAGQSIESLSGMLAFLTRNGLSASRSATSAARALDAISNPKTVDNLEHFGNVLEAALGKKAAAEYFGSSFKKMSVNIKDAAGNFLPMNEIMTKLGVTLSKLPNPQKAAVLQELFKSSGGTIQARRFFDIAIRQFGQLNSLTHSMIDSKGALDDAYKIMFNTPAARAQLLSNKISILKTQIGDYLIPVKTRLINLAIKLLDAWDRLSPGTQKLIVQIAAFASALLVLGGAVVATTGLFLMFAGAAALAGTSVAAVLVPIGLIIAAIAALGVAIFLVWKNHETVFGLIKSGWTSLYNFIKPLIDLIVGFFSKIWTSLQPILQDLWNQIRSALGPALRDLKGAWDELLSAFSDLGPVWNQVIKPALKEFWGILKIVLAGAILTTIATLITLVHIFVGVVVPAVKFVAEAVRAMAKIIAGVINLVAGLITGDWRKAWHGLTQIVRGAWDLVFAIIRGAWNIIVGLVKGIVNGVIHAFQFMKDVVVGHSIIPDMVNAIAAWFRRLPGMIMSSLTSLPGKMTSLGVSMMKGMLGGITSMATRVAGAAANIAKAAYNAASSAVKAKSPSRLFHQLGQWVGQGYIGGLVRSIPNIVRAGKRMAAASNQINVQEHPGPVVSGREGGPGGPGAGGAVVNQTFNIKTQEINPVKHAADLGWELAVKVA